MKYSTKTYLSALLASVSFQLSLTSGVAVADDVSDSPFSYSPLYGGATNAPLANGGSALISYDAFGLQTTKISASQVQLMFQYDRSGRRVAKSSSSNVSYIYGQSQHVGGLPRAVYSEVNAAFTYLVANTQIPQGSSTTETKRQITDHNASVRAFQVMSGSITSGYGYSVTGEAKTATALMADGGIPVRYQSHIEDTETGLVDFGTRFYSPHVTARFLDTDFAGQSVSPYSAFMNNRINGTDADGALWRDRQGRLWRRADDPPVYRGSKGRFWRRRGPVSISAAPSNSSPEENTGRPQQLGTSEEKLQATEENIVAAPDSLYAQFVERPVTRTIIAKKLPPRTVKYTRKPGFGDEETQRNFLEERGFTDIASVGASSTSNWGYNNFGIYEATYHPVANSDVVGSDFDLILPIHHISAPSVERRITTTRSLFEEKGLPSVYSRGIDPLYPSKEGLPELHLAGDTDRLVIYGGHHRLVAAHRTGIPVRVKIDVGEKNRLGYHWRDIRYVDRDRNFGHVNQYQAPEFLLVEPSVERVSFY